MDKQVNPMVQLDRFQTVVIEKPSDVIIRQIRELIHRGEMLPGDRLPSERTLSERFGVGRTYVRDALKKMEFYGILKTLPQSGTVVAGLDIMALDGMLSDVLKFDNYDFISLVEARVTLEEQLVRFCAIRRTKEDLATIKAALDQYKTCINEGESTVSADFEFHRCIARGSQNRVLQSMNLLITSDILFHYHQYGICGNNQNVTLKEHSDLYDAILDQDAENAARLMVQHLASVKEFAKEKI